MKPPTKRGPQLYLVLNFLLWGSGSLLLSREKLFLLPLLLHLYLYLLATLLLLVSPLSFLLLSLPVASLGGAYFTLELGRLLRPPKDAAPSLQPKGFCHSCGTKLPKGANYCPGCGVEQRLEGREIYGE